MHSIMMSFPLDPVWNLGIELHSNNHNLDTNLLTYYDYIRIYLYTNVNHMKEILMCYVSTME